MIYFLHHLHRHRDRQSERSHLPSRPFSTDKYTFVLINFPEMPTLNPIILGFSPDPTVAKVDGWFFLVTSTFHLFPGLPVYASKDLTLWKQIGANCLYNEESQNF